VALDIKEINDEDSMKRKDIEKALEANNVGYDRIVCHKDGAVSVKMSFFYPHGKSSSGLAEKVLAALPGSTLISAIDDWQSWPKDSYFVAKIRPACEA